MAGDERRFVKHATMQSQPTRRHVDLERIGAMVTRRARRVFRPTIIRHRGVRLAVDARVLSPTMVVKLYEGG